MKRSKNDIDMIDPPNNNALKPLKRSQTLRCWNTERTETTIEHKQQQDEITSADANERHTGRSSLPFADGAIMPVPCPACANLWGGDCPVCRSTRHISFCNKCYMLGYSDDGRCKYCTLAQMVSRYQSM